MSMKSKLLLFFLLLPVILYGNDLTKLGLKGKVKCYKTISYQLLSKKEIKETGGTLYFFNTDGNFLATYFYDGNGSLLFHDEYIYDDVGLLKEIRSYSGSAVEYSKDVYDYQDYQCSGFQRYSEDGIYEGGIKYEYDSDGTRIKEIDYDSEGNVSKIIEYTYKNGLQTEKKEYDSKKVLKSQETIKYLNNGLISETESKSSTGDIYKHSYKYDANYNLIKLEGFKNKEKDSISEYVLDNNGNIIKAYTTIFYNGLALNSITEYDYY